MTQVKAAFEEDLIKIIDLLKLVWEKTYRGLLDNEYIEIANEKYFTEKKLLSKLNDPDVEFLLAKEGSEVIGLIMARKIGDHTIYIASLYIHPQHQGKRIGKLLLESIVPVFGEITKIQLNVIKKNSKAVGFYEKNGFVMEGLDELETETFGVEVYKMTKEL